MIRTLLSASLAALLAVAAPASAKESQPDRPTYGPRLEGYNYPFPVRTYAFNSQRQPLEMTYMDVAPTGPANGRTALLLHGKNFCAATWAPTIRVLAQAGFRVIAVDQIGFCKASKPADYQFSLPQLATNTKGLLDSLNIDRAVIVGHSMGGMLAARFAIQHPDAVERLVLVNPIGLEDWQAEGVPYAPLDAAYANERRTTFDTIKTYQRKFYYDGQWRPEYDEPVAMLAGMYAGPGGDAVAWNQAQTSDMIFTQPIAHEFARIAAPTTLIIGGTDRTAPGANRASPEIQARLGQYPALGRRTAEAIPDATLVEFPALGHAPQTQDPARFHAALLKALN
ncbi:alpha/beta fold hydrolase [Brevundimonas sp. PWP3-1b1]|uniref:alpha/beta fold hydrolase n=1 Tax=unclassified Brevundimonas TaxID=2622653 RepID=UPI003CF6D7B4